MIRTRTNVEKLAGQKIHAMARRDRCRDERGDGLAELSSPEPHDDEDDGVDLEGSGESDEDAPTPTPHDQ